MYSKPVRHGFLCRKFRNELRRHRGYEKGHMKIQSQLEFCPSTTPQIEPLIYVPGSKSCVKLFAFWKMLNPAKSFLSRDVLKFSTWVLWNPIFGIFAQF